MDAVVMAGGAGTRLDAPVEKPLFEVGDRPMVDRVLAALAGSEVDRIAVAVSPHTPETADSLRERMEHTAAPTEEASASERAPVDGAIERAAPDAVVETPGEGYVADLDAALSAVNRPALTVAADLPLLAPAVVDRVLAAADDAEGSLSVCVPVALKQRLGASVDAADGSLAPTGCNVVGDGTTSEDTMLSYDARLAVNVNRRTDARLAEALLCE